MKPTDPRRRRFAIRELLAGYADRQADREARRIEQARLGIRRKREGYRFWVARKT